ncbi:ADP-L-glycero-D-manno-heptose-6-epimerase [uncultured archaeon]|nr:ADP-L-glycero-D-manno-heptose-6-epimerase [uncultured archaeon]
MDILVTGGAGFIGSNLAAALAKAGHRVTVLDNFHSGSEQNLAGLSVKLVKGGAGDLDKLDVGKPEVIFHQGVYSSSPMYKENPRLVAKAIDDFIVLLEFAKKCNAQVVFASTSSMYNGITPPHKEDIIPKVTDFYTEARIAMERMAELYHRLYGMKIIGLRYFSVYGPHEEAKGKYANLISQFLWAMKKGEAPVIYGDGTQTRDFTYVEDVVRANILAMESKSGFGMYNVGTGRTYTLNQLVEILNAQLGTSIRPAYIENKIKNYVQATLADTAKAKKELGFEAKVSLEEGIGKLIALYK